MSITESTNSTRRRGVRKGLRLRQRSAGLLRWLHVYLSMISFAVVLFFAATGLTVNHPSWIAHEKTSLRHGTVNPSLLSAPAGKPYKPLQLVDAIRRQEQLHGQPEELRIDDGQISYSMRAPGYSADVFVDRMSGRYDATVVSYGAMAFVNDLHRGRDVGPYWKWINDLCAGFLCLVSLSGLGLLCFMNKKIATGLALAVIGLTLSTLALLPLFF